MGPLPAELRRAIGDALGSDIRRVSALSGGRSARTYRLDLTGDPETVVCKVGGPSVRTGDVVEPLVLEYVGANLDLPVPSVLLEGTLANGEDTRWAVYEFCEGSPPSYRSLDPAVRARLVRNVGEVLGRLHEAGPFERTGGFGRDGNRLVIRDEAGLQVPRRIRNLLERFGDVSPDRRPVLAHGDLFPGNLLVDDRGTITGLVDWGNAHVTTPGYALARAQVRFVDWYRFPAGHRRRLGSALQSGYRARRPLPPDYPSWRGVYGAGWLLQSADRVRRHLRTARGRRQMGGQAVEVLSSIVPELGRDTADT